MKTRLATQPGREDTFILTRIELIVHQDGYHLLVELGHEHEGEAGGLEALGEGEASTEEEEDSPAHLGLDQPPGDQGRGLLVALLGVGARPEVVRLGQHKQQQHD